MYTAHVWKWAEAKGKLEMLLYITHHQIKHLKDTQSPTFL